MLIECPDCGRKVSDRAQECPDCCCPVAEVVGEQEIVVQRSSATTSRELLEGREVDCPRCEARGYRELPTGMFEWCIVCEHSGRTALARATDGYYAVARYAVARFLAGELHVESSGVVFLVGPVEPIKHKFPQAGPREPVDVRDPEIPWEDD